MYKSAGIVARYDKKEALELTEKLKEYLQNKNVQVYVEDSLKGKVDFNAKFVSLDKMDVEFIIIIGGDGTILRTCLNLYKPDVPIIAINMGVRGFLTEVEPVQSIEAIDRILSGKFKIEKCAKLSTQTNNKSIPEALNDVVISGGEPSKILYMQIWKNDEPILKCEADGVIIATQTGSTGYSLSAGGPVIDREVDAIVVTPICSLTTFRSLIFPANSKITIELLRPKEMLILIDGNYRLLLPAEKPSISVTKSTNNASFIRFKDDFYNRLHSRLLFKGTG